MAPIVNPIITPIGPASLIQLTGCTKAPQPIALGSAIGWGAFVQPVHWMSEAGPMGVIIGFTIGAILMMLIAVSYGFLIRSFPVSGGEFAYSFISMGRTHAFISAWFLTLGYLGIVALNASAFALMFKFVLPSIIEQLPMYTIA